jgi:hypothetical protein
LILRKMYEKSDPKLKDIYRQVLERFWTMYDKVL